MVEMRFTMAIVFISFTYLYLDCFQDDVLADWVTMKKYIS